jgi:steroid 5-alpha reductase family enzyme
MIDFESLKIAAGVIFIMMSGVWIASLFLKDVSIVDSFWGFGFGAVAFALYFVNAGGEAQAILTFLVSLWSLRLGLHLFIRWSAEPEEDHRYQAMRHNNPGFWWRSLYIVFGLQGLLMWVVALPVQIALSVPAVSANLWIYPAAFISVAGLLIETFADIQLNAFRKNPENNGKVLNTGLWSVSRHPNYFGDALFWWGIWCVSVTISLKALIVIFAPALMTFLIVKISGADLLEKSLVKTRPGYQDYMAQTNRFIPKLF